MIGKPISKCQMGLLTLPPELFYMVSDFLQLKDLAALLRISRQIHPVLKYILYCREVEENNHAILAWAVRRQRITTFKNALAALHCHCHSHVTESQCTVLSTLNKTLCLASSGGHTSFVKLLLDRGADGNTEGGGHATALELAYLHRHQDIIQILLAANS
jgi:hypothetical protein